PDLGACSTVLPHDVMSVSQHYARAWRDDAADDADERGLAGSVRSQEREDLALADLEIDRLQSLKPGGVDLRDIRNRNGGLSVRSAQVSRLRARGLLQHESELLKEVIRGPHCAPALLCGKLA